MPIGTDSECDRTHTKASFPLALKFSIILRLLLLLEVSECSSQAIAFLILATMLSHQPITRRAQSL
ncbi:hypothetical protein [Trichocoleus sp. DQ-U1]|uniref:hypothetical protein n=1 Tax=Trichocoleus sp. DQ-U1 TaxID=2933926 RepID=UPI003297D50F